MYSLTIHVSLLVISIKPRKLKNVFATYKSFFKRETSKLNERIDQKADGNINTGVVRSGVEELKVLAARVVITNMEGAKGHGPRTADDYCDKPRGENTSLDTI